MRSLHKVSIHCCTFTKYYYILGHFCLLHHVFSFQIYELLCASCCSSSHTSKWIDFIYHIFQVHSILKDLIHKAMSETPVGSCLCNILFMYQRNYACWSIIIHTINLVSFSGVKAVSCSEGRGWKCCSWVSWQNEGTEQKSNTSTGWYGM